MGWRASPRAANYGLGARGKAGQWVGRRGRDAVCDDAGCRWVRTWVDESISVHALCVDESRCAAAATVGLGVGCRVGDDGRVWGWVGAVDAWDWPWVGCTAVWACADTEFGRARTAAEYVAECEWRGCRAGGRRVAAVAVCGVGACDACRSAAAKVGEKG